MQIGELAQRFGLNPKTIRYYEEIGLLPRPQRTVSGYRQYDETAVSLLGFAQRAKLLGLSLEDIRDILAIHERGEEPCDRVLALIDRELVRIEQRVTELQRLHVELTELRRQWPDTTKQRPDDRCLCPIIEQQTIVAIRPPLERTLEPTGRRGRVQGSG